MRLWSGKPSFVSRWTDAAGEAGAGGLRYEAARARRGHVETWALDANDPQAPRALSLRWSVWAGERAPRRAVAEAWAVAFGTREGHVATKVAVPFEQATFGRKSFGLAIDGSTLAERVARGRVESGGRAIAYDLELPPIGSREAWPALPGTSALLPDALIHGVLGIGDEVWTLDSWPASLWHRWGRAHDADSAWGHCIAWDDDSEDLAIEGATWRPRLGVAFLPARTRIVVRYAGEATRFGGSVSPVRTTQAEGNMTPRRWRFLARGSRFEIEGEMWADTEEFVGLFCPNPDGTTIHRLETKLARAEVTLRLPGRPARTLRSRRAALEISTRDPHHGVRMHV
jgi:hypothetical protein